MSDENFPQEKTEAEVGFDALELDTDKMLAELHSIADEARAVTEPEPETEPEPDEEPSEPEPTPAEPSAAVPPGYIEFEGEHWPVEEVRALLELNRRMKAEPDVAQRVHQAIVPPPSEPQLPDWINPDDPTAVRLYQETERNRAELERMQAQAQTRASEDRRTQVVDAFKDAVSDFRSKYPDLSDEQVYRVGDLAGRSGIFDALERSEGSLRAGFAKGMEMTLWSEPSLRSTVSQGAAAKVPADGSKERKRKAAALAPGGAPASRAAAPEHKPRTREELIEAMLRDQRESLAEN